MTTKRIKSSLVAGLFAVLALPMIVTGSASAATVDVACADLPAAIASASAGDTLNVNGNCTLTSNTVINKQLTISGVGGATISTSGTNQIFTITSGGAGTTFQGFNVVKTDKTGVQNIIGIQANGVSILNNTFSGQFVIGDGDVSRAVEVSPGVQNVAISGNSFKNLRQPVYVNDNVTGTVSNNFVDGTKGFVVVANSNLSFTGNSWGANVVDIAFISAGTVPNNYPCEVVLQIRRDNNNAKIDNQAQATPCPTYPVTKDDCKDGGYKAFTGKSFKNQGECVSYVASGGKSGGNALDKAVAFVRSLPGLI